MTEQQLETNETQVEEIQQEEQPREVSKKEELAVQMGWTPKEEFKGNPEQWIDADRYVDRAFENPALTKTNLGKVLNQGVVTKKELAEVKKQLDEFGQMHMNAMKQQRETLLKEVTAKQREAVESGDVEKWEALEKEKESLTQDPSPKKEEQPQVKMPDPQEQEIALDFFERNPWYHADPIARQRADLFFNQYEVQNPDAPLSEKLEYLQTQMQNKRPDLFNDSPRAGLPKVEGTRRAGQNAVKSYEDLPADAKAACNLMVRKGITTKETYVKEFFGE